MKGIKVKLGRPKGAKLIGLIILGLLTAVFFGFVFGFFVKLLWNWLMPDLFNLKEITYWQAFGLVILARLIFGSFGSNHNNESKSSGHKKKQWQSEDKKEDIKDEPKNWKFYDEWWKDEGKEAFDDYVEKKYEEKEKKEDSENSCKE